MRVAVFCLGVIISSVSGYCPSLEYTLTGETCIRALQLWTNDTIINLQPQSQRDCGLDGASLPIIKNAEDNDFFNQVANNIDEIAGWNNYLMLGLVCNPWTHELRWQDGSAVDYTPGLNMNFDCTKYTAVSRTKFGDWKLVSVADTWSYTVFCVTDPKYIN
ncbi:hypothetical protein PRIPAC_85034 [Pristionchus pacificus]|uniref:C-type lectin domain-containing protein n=1 Tax=Pristionchus pacificus TaxID=54126 RepID=A0A2A6CES5_PRIPA|nr:hypothetical protein PRIPAC_85034 [Pristionchus pacificus]|eukprot:PDM76588.1 hypothetical protein PRIPAC_42954 [Pristionchus pacificus]